MMRDSLKTKDWFNEWTEFLAKSIQDRHDARAQPPKNPRHEPQFVFEISTKNLQLIFRRYSRGDSISELASYFDPILDAWEEAERLGKEVWSPEIQHSRHSWKVNLDHYIRCFWLVGLALSLKTSDAQWQRLLALINLGGNEGSDALLDRVISSREKDRLIGSTLCHPKPYQRLLDAINAPPTYQASLLKTFVANWYKELDRLPKKGLARETAMYERPYWYDYHEIDGGYFGYWCVEAAACVAAFGMDDSKCLGMPNYPGDLLRPSGPTTHPQNSNKAQADAMSVVSRPESLGDKVRRWMFAPKS